MKGKKRKAVAGILLTLALLAAAQALHLYAFFPTDTLRGVEADYNTGRTEIVLQVYRNDDGQRKWLVFLSGNENAVILSHSRFYLRNGWDGMGKVIDCSRENKPVYASAYRTPLTGGVEPGTSRWLVRTFGRVEDQRIQTVEIRFVGSSTDAETEQTTTGQLYCQRSERKDWTEHEGDHYFFMETQALDISRGQKVEQRLMALDAQGNVIAEYALSG